MDDAFGHWLAGFTDGEGAFMVVRVTSRNGNPNLKTWPNCRYEISLRADDAAILRTIRDTLGYGSLHVHTASKTRPGENVAVKYGVHRIGDCQKVVDLFTRYPLRAKKRAQFEVWADAVREVAKGAYRDNDLIEDYRRALAELRKFVPPEALATIREGNPPRLKHRNDLGTAPLCLCGCGEATLPVSNSQHRPHPDNPNFGSFRRGHWRRLLKQSVYAP